MPRIKVHEKALAHLSRGLYRSPASALRELVSNAWDAGASTVRVGTNYPNFLQLSVEDDGGGFSKAEFEQLMSGGIGNSPKRSKPPSKSNRPVIGRLGIGMLGVAQICGTFTIESKPEKGDGFRARVHLYDLLKERLDRDDPELVKLGGPPDDPVKEVDVGRYDFDSDFDPRAARPGTRILADDLHPTFVRSFQKSLELEKYVAPPLEWPRAVKLLSKHASLQELGDYWRLLWELSVACPIPYLQSSALPRSVIAEEHERLESYGFTLIVDSIELRKPVSLARNKAGYSVWPIHQQEIRVYGKPLRFHGYILVQEGTQLKPDELRGILIRIKDVAIGYYDPSLLDYRYNEGPRAKWVTGELFIDEGLEDALNLDRESFNRFHPDFRALQEFLHALLHDSVFPQTYKEIDKRTIAKRETQQAERTRLLRAVLSEALDRPVSIRSAVPELGDRAVLHVSRDKAQVELPAEIDTRASSQPLARAILAIFELSIRERDRDEQRRAFRVALLKLLRKW